MILIGCYLLIAFACAAGLGYVAAAARLRGRVADAEERAEAALADAGGLAESLRGLQASLELQWPVTPGDISTAMPRTEALVLAAAERDYRSHRLLPLRTRLTIRRAERAASRT
jgi:hypothetical protein